MPPPAAKAIPAVPVGKASSASSSDSQRSQRGKKSDRKPQKPKAKATAATLDLLPEEQDELKERATSPDDVLRAELLPAQPSERQGAAAEASQLKALLADVQAEKKRLLEESEAEKKRLLEESEADKKNLQHKAAKAEADIQRLRDEITALKLERTEEAVQTQVVANALTPAAHEARKASAPNALPLSTGPQSAEESCIEVIGNIQSAIGLLHKSGGAIERLGPAPQGAWAESPFDTFHMQGISNFVRFNRNALTHAMQFLRAQLIEARGVSPLMLCAVSGYAEQTRTLIRAGADRTETDVIGHTPMLVAWQHGHADVVRALRRFDGAEGQVQSGRGAIIIDAGTGELKLLALLARPHFELHELAVHKTSLPDLSIDFANNGSLIESLEADLQQGLEKVTPEFLGGVAITWGMLGATAWYRKMSLADRTRADRMLGRVKEAVDAKLKTLGIEATLKIEEVRTEGGRVVRAWQLCCWQPEPVPVG